MIMKGKIVNDPVYGFIRFPEPEILQLIDHRWFQRLRYIRQMGPAHLVYPGAVHTRFHHSLGAVHLMGKALDELRAKGVAISEQESLAARIAILMHDIGHGPFSHALEHTLVEGVTHEYLSGLIMNELNREYDGMLSNAIRVFDQSYEKPYLHQLVSSQLDVDRMDYLNRDSFYTGVSEGVIGYDRILNMLTVKDHHLMVEEKGVHSVEKFVIARRLMYWQVYLHKTVVAAEFMLLNVLKRARQLIHAGEKLYATPTLKIFLENSFLSEDFRRNIEIEGRPVLNWYTLLDDNDIFISMKEWQHHSDPVLSKLAECLTNRELFRIRMMDKPLSKKKEESLLALIREKIIADPEDAKYFLMSDVITNSAYNKHDENIFVLYKDHTIKELNEASDINLSVLSKAVRKYFVCYPKELDIY